jgi:molybdopterin converting factor small subunit
VSEAEKTVVTVKLFAFFRENRFKVRELAFPAGTTVRDIVLAQDIDPDEVGVTMINSRHCDLDHIPLPGDQVAIFPVIGGG